jgi:hypothetical protein
MRSDAEQRAEEAACARHEPTYGEIGFECRHCGKFLFRYGDNSFEALGVRAEARRLVDKGFHTSRTKPEPKAPSSE